MEERPPGYNDFFFIETSGFSTNVCEALAA
jgi:hypothetical protein